MTGSNYIATKRLSNQADDTLAEVGETCERVPVESFDWLIAQGLIVPVVTIRGGEIEPAPIEHAVADDGIETRTEGDA